MNVKKLHIGYWNRYYIYIHFTSTTEGLQTYRQKEEPSTNHPTRTRYLEDDWSGSSKAEVYRAGGFPEGSSQLNKTM